MHLTVHPFATSRGRSLAVGCSTAPKPSWLRSGFHGASVEEIAREAGATTGALYSNFAGKEDLFLALFEERIAADVGDYSQIVAAGTTIEEQARGAADRWMAILRERPDYFPLLIEFCVYAIREPALRERLAGRFAALRSASARLAVEGAERQGYSPGAEAGELGAGSSTLWATAWRWRSWPTPTLSPIRFSGTCSCSSSLHWARSHARARAANDG